ncbi:MAG: hypothetical protein MJ197_10820 [Bacteroidales bacterium]|nr:hypothetical protein [Bacteroidales bacterium]
MKTKIEKQTEVISMAGRKVGNIRFFERDGKVHSRIATTNHMTNDRTGAQMMNRLMFSSARAMWSCFKGQLKDSFESVELGKSPYTTFVKLNHNNGVFLTKKQLNDHFMIITPLHISDGTLEPIQQMINDDKQLVTNIVLGDFEITEETTIRDFSICISNNNPNIEYNDELNFVAAKQEVTDYGKPTCKVEVNSLKLELYDERPLLAIMGKCPLVNKDGYLASKAGLDKGCYAFYLSREEGKEKLVSSQMLVSNNDELIEQYISEEQFTEARQSFGKSEDPFIYGWKFEKPTFE